MPHTNEKSIKHHFPAIYIFPLFLCFLTLPYSLRFKMSIILVKKNCFKINVTLHFQYNFNFFLSTLPSINTSTFLTHNFQYNFKFVFFLDSLVKVLCLMIISFHFLICVQLTKTTFILKRREYFFNQNHTMS